MSKDFIHNNILQGVADAIRYCDDTTAGIAPVDYADRIRAIDKLIPQPDALNFYMPNGGTISLNKTGTPTVVELEYSLDRGTTWTVWQEDENGNRSLTLNAGQRVYIRNTSETSTYFSTNSNRYYQFDFTDTTYAYGNTNSLLCKNPNNSVIRSRCFYCLFYFCEKLVSAPEIPSTITEHSCYYYMFAYSGITIAPYLPAAIVNEASYRRMFYQCQNLNKVYTAMTDISSLDCIRGWLSYVAAQGDFYCPAELTIPTGASGIPSGWTRHDI